jgi:hypothetical protein
MEQDAIVVCDSDKHLHRSDGPSVDELTEPCFVSDREEVQASPPPDSRTNANGRNRTTLCLVRLPARWIQEPRPTSHRAHGVPMPADVRPSHPLRRQMVRCVQARYGRKLSEGGICGDFS